MPSHAPSTSCLFLYANVRSLVPKYLSLLQYISLYNPLVICLTETWLYSDIPSNFISPPGYQCYRCDRDFSKGGGTIIFVRSYIKSTDLTFNVVGKPSPNVIDFNAVRLSFSRSNIVDVLCVYRPPHTFSDQNNFMYAVIGMFLSNSSYPKIIVGDFNFPSITWPLCASDSIGEEFLNFCSDNFLTQNVGVATRPASSSILDLVLTSNAISVQNLSVNERFASSDHCTITFNIQCCSTSANFLNNSGGNKKFLHRDYRNADWEYFNSLLSDVDFSFIHDLDVDINDVWSLFIERFSDCYDQACPLKYVKVKDHFLNSKIRTALRHKRRWYNKWRVSPDFHTYMMYNRSLEILNEELNSAIASYEKHVARQLTSNPKLFWKYVGGRLAEDSAIKHVCVDNVDIVSSKEIADAFNDHFSSIFSSAAPVQLAVLSHQPNLCSRIKTVPSEQLINDNVPCIKFVSISIADVKRVIRSLPDKKSNDVDGLSYFVIKKGIDALLVPLCNLFNRSLSRAEVPMSWKTAVVTPIFKSGSKQDVKNYRPISVTSCVSRILERLVRRFIISFLTVNRVLNTTQHGFQSRKSTDTALLSFYDFVTKNVDQGYIVDAIFLDMAKAFDVVPHDQLIRRIADCGISGSLLRWISEFLCFRKQKVRIGSDYSELQRVTSGVVQGTVLGPLLFSMYVNSIDDAVTHCHVLKYADDIRLFLSIPKDNMHDYMVLIQNDINAMVKWVDDAGMNFNVQKSFHLRFGRISNTTQYSVKDVRIPLVATAKDLGVRVNVNLCWNEHIDYCVLKANQRLSLIYKCFNFKSKHIILTLYKNCVRPILEYGSIVWNPFTVRNKCKLEKVQRRMCRMIVGMKDLSYLEQLRALDIFSLSARRIRYQLIFVYKLRHNLIDLDVNDFFSFRVSSQLRGHDSQLYHDYAFHNYRLRFFTHFVGTYWNKLSQDVINSCSIAQFKKKLTPFLRDVELCEL